MAAAPRTTSRPNAAPAFSLALPYWASASPRWGTRRRALRLGVRLQRRSQTPAPDTGRRRREA